jgi:hypothetical protein
MKQLVNLHAIENGGLPYYKWKAAYLTRRTVEHVQLKFEMILIALCLLLVSLGVLKK